MCPWGAQSQNICRFLQILWFIYPSHSGYANCQVPILYNLLFSSNSLIILLELAVVGVCITQFIVVLFYFLRNDGMEDRYSILMTFDSQDSTDDFYHHFNGKPFSSLEVCGLCSRHITEVFYWIYLQKESRLIVLCIKFWASQNFLMPKY